jgi:hypothetical protein
MKKIIVLFLVVSTIIYAQIGRTDVVGYTYYDWQWNGPPFTNCVCDTNHGIHVSWGGGTPPNYLDRNMGYNYYNFSTGTWNWLTFGMIVFTLRISAWGMDVDFVTGNAVLSSTQPVSSNTAPALARDQAPGAGLWEYLVGPIGYKSPPIAITNNQAIHLVMSGNTYDSLYYMRVQPWGNWTTPINIGSPYQAGYPNYNINGSKLSNKIVVTWDATDDSSKYYRQSLDGGLSWQNPVSFMPPAFTPGSETIPGSWLGSFGFYDRNDNIHIVTQASPFGYVWPAEIWHYCPVNNPSWSRIHRADAVNISATIGYNGIAACRPSLAQNPITGALYCIWEQFDSLNYEPITSRLRADIQMSESYNNGLTWVNNHCITTTGLPNVTSKRFPIVAGTVWRDTLWVRYMIDSISGFAIYDEGRATRNPIVVQWVPVSSEFAIEEHSSQNTQQFMLYATPNPFTSHITIRLRLNEVCLRRDEVRYSLPAQSNILLEIYDITGRIIKTFNAVSGQRLVSFSGLVKIIKAKLSRTVSIFAL